MKLLPDFGTYLLQNKLDHPFKLQVYNDLILAEDRVLGWMINGSTTQFSVSSIDSNPIPNINQPYMFSIYLGRGSKTRSEKILSRFQTEGLVIVPREDKRYLVSNQQEWVIPLQYINAK
jgi:hypothetical protein